MAGDETEAAEPGNPHLLDDLRGDDEIDLGAPKRPGRARGAGIPLEGHVARKPGQLPVDEDRVLGRACTVSPFRAEVARVTATTSCGEVTHQWCQRFATAPGPGELAPVERTARPAHRRGINDSCGTQLDRAGDFTLGHSPNSSSSVTILTPSIIRGTRGATSGTNNAQ